MNKIVDTTKTPRGAITAHTGSSNEHFTNHLLNGYYDDLEQRLVKGDQIDSAHKKAVKKLKNKPYLDSLVKQQADLYVARKILGDKEMFNIFEDSKMTATAVAQHIVDRYSSHIISSVHVGKSGPNIVKQITGLPSQADIIVETNQMIDFLHHRGLSLKYSKAKGTSIKIHSPTPKTLASIIEEHYEKLFGNPMGIQGQLTAFAGEGLLEQQKALKPYHEILQNFFNNLGDSRKTYVKLVNSDGEIIGGDLSRPATSHLRDSDSTELRAIYDKMAEQNLIMKKKMSKVFYDGVEAVMTYKPGEYLDIKESLLRSIANVQSIEKLTQLPTMIVSTDRDKGVHIFDVNNYLETFIKLNGVETCSQTKESSGFKLGPLTVGMDTRPTTCLNPVTTFPMTVTMSCAELKKNA